jgi:hypothetical protein
VDELLKKVDDHEVLDVAEEEFFDYLLGYFER